MGLEGPTVLVQVRLPAGAALEDAVRKLGLAPDEVDRDYGLVPTDPEHGSFVLLVTAAAGERIGILPGVSGPYSNPRIEPYGPPESP
jgi:hypothetical protein